MPDREADVFVIPTRRVGVAKWMGEGGRRGRPGRIINSIYKAMSRKPLATG